MFSTTQLGVQCSNKECGEVMGVDGFVHIYLLTGEIAMHLFYGFDSLISQDTLQNLNYVHQRLGMEANTKDNKYRFTS